MSESRKNASKTCGKPIKSSAPVKPKGTSLNTKLAAASAVAKKNPRLAPSPSPSEANAIADAHERIAVRRARIAVLAESENGALRISPPHSDDAGFAARLLDTFGTESSDFANRAMGRLGVVMRSKGSALPTQTEFNAALAAFDGIRPADEIEAMLAVQMVATHETAMDMLIRAKQADLTPTLQECGSLAVKLLRTFTVQVEALGRLRRGGEQRVIVQHVNVNEGGRAIVGTVSHPRGGSEK
jgi:hypothetical protein